MNSTVSINVRTLVVAGVTAAATISAYLVGSAEPEALLADAAAAPAPVSAETASIAMSGTGEATGVPDQVVFSLTVSTSAADVSTALASANDTTQDVLEAVRGEGVDAADLQTAGLSLHPTYDYSGDGPAVLTGYAATQTLSVLVRSLADTGATISAAVEAGGNAVQLGSVRLQIGDEDALLAQARDDAMAEAQAKAQQYAEASGRPLGEVISVREVHATSTQPQSLDERTISAAAAADVSAVPIRAGSEDLGVTVQVVWSFA